jgi:hypothetical protein
MFVGVSGALELGGARLLLSIGGELILSISALGARSTIVIHLPPGLLPPAGFSR